jgi:hypothetical protein
MVAMPVGTCFRVTVAVVAPVVVVVVVALADVGVEPGDEVGELLPQATSSSATTTPMTASTLIFWLMKYLVSMIIPFIYYSHSFHDCTIS